MESAGTIDLDVAILQYRANGANCAVPGFALQYRRNNFHFMVTGNRQRRIGFYDKIRVIVALMRITFYRNAELRRQTLTLQFFAQQLRFTFTPTSNSIPNVLFGFTGIAIWDGGIAELTLTGMICLLHFEPAPKGHWTNYIMRSKLPQVP